MHNDSFALERYEMQLRNNDFAYSNGVRKSRKKFRLSKKMYDFI